MARPKKNKDSNAITLTSIVVTDPVNNNNLPAVIEFHSDPIDPTNMFINGLVKSYSEPVYNDITILKDRLTLYFKQVQLSHYKPTLTGLMLFLGYASKQSYYDNENSEIPGVSYLLKRAKQIIEHWYEEGLHDNRRVTGSIFALKQFGWIDNQKIDLGLENLVKAPKLNSDDYKAIAQEMKKQIG